VLKRLVAGLECMHDDEDRQVFLLELGGKLAQVATWLRGAGLDGKIDAGRAPTFLHGGSSIGRWLVMGINPGADDQSGVKEERFKRESPERYLAFHNEFFEHFPKLRRNAKQPWWRKLYRVTRVFDDEVAASVPVPWSTLCDDSNFVVQDLLPFHGRSSATLRPRDFESGVLRQISDATIAGVATSKARGVLVCSRMGYSMFRKHAQVLDVRGFALRGKTRTNKPRTIDGYTARIGAVPLVALDNEIIAQPKFPYAQVLPKLVEVLRKQKLV